jgi:phosphatidylethanolamine/phosphatidyl-N-methylethanolamine N-methyltransferase
LGFDATYYDSLNYESKLQRIVMQAGHKLVEKDFTEDDYFPQVLEVGCGTGEHFRHVAHRFDSFICSDIDVKSLSIAQQKINAKNVDFVVCSGFSIPFPDNKFDRLISTHVLEHLSNPVLAVLEWARVLKHNGVLSILLPTDPGLFWRIGRSFGPRRNATKFGIDYDYVMAIEHVNSCYNLLSILRHHFPIYKEMWWPLRVTSVDLNLFYCFQTVIKK